MKKAILTLTLCLTTARAFCAVGQVSFFVSSSCPAGWLDMHDSLSISSYTYGGALVYPELYNVVVDSPVWGGQAGSSVLLPSLGGTSNEGGYFLRAWSEHKTRQRGSLQDDAFQGHTHYDGEPSYQGGRWGYDGGFSNFPYNVPGGFGNASSADKGSPPISDGTNGTPRYGVETRPRNISLIACVQAVSDSSTTISGGSMGIFSDFTWADLSFWFGVIMAFATIWGFKAGGMGK